MLCRNDVEFNAMLYHSLCCAQTVFTPITLLIAEERILTTLSTESKPLTDSKSCHSLSSPLDESLIPYIKVGGNQSTGDYCENITFS